LKPQMATIFFALPITMTLRQNESILSIGLAFKPIERSNQKRKTTTTRTSIDLGVKFSISRRWLFIFKWRRLWM